MDHLTEILTKLADDKIDYIVGGGVAAVLHGVERVTMDLDIAIDWNPANVARFLTAMSDLHLQPKMPVAPDLLLDREALNELLVQKGALVFSFYDINDPVRLVDIFIRPELGYEVLNRDADTVDILGRSIKIISAGRLLTLKQSIRPPRPKDELDIGCLKKIVESSDD